MRSLGIIVAALFLCSLASPQALAKGKAAKPTAKAAAKTAAKAAPREIPQSVIRAIAAGDLSSAVIALREEPPSPKNNYLIRTATSVVLSQIGDKPNRSEEHQYHQNLGIAFHNLFLFLKAQGVTNEEYADQALKNYKKARRAGTVLHKAECDLLTAALHASMGDREKARKLFDKIDKFMLRSDFESAEYLATYYAAMGDAGKASEAIRTAYEINPNTTLAWLEVGDDFHDIESDPVYKEMLSSLSKERKDKELTLSVPESSDPKLQIENRKPAK